MAPKTSDAKQAAAIFVALLAFRIINALSVKTFFQPDEYFQALEPAWQMAFGPQSGAWITWEWRERLRTSVHPYIFAAVYRATDWICRLLHADDGVRANALGATPRVLQALSAASLDFLTWRIAGKVYGSGHTATWAALAVTICSPWQWFCSVRTFSNSLETTLTAAALYYFPFECFLVAEPARDRTVKDGPVEVVRDTPTELYLALTVAAVATYLRPTNIIIWISISSLLVWYSRSFHKAKLLFFAATLVGSQIIIGFAGADRLYYDKWTIPPVKFLYLNLVQSLAVFYGQNRVDYYFTEGLPLLLTTALPFALLGLYQSFGLNRRTQTASISLERSIAFVLGITTVATVLAFSAIRHKEVRFIYPLLPIFHVLSARPVASFFVPIGRSKFRSLILLCGLAANVYIAFYVSTVHQRGVVDVVHYLRHRQESWFEASASGRLPETVAANISVGFLMPCHSTPWRSHFVYSEINAWALTCEPPINLNAEQRLSYLDEADVFYANPKDWLSNNMKDISTISHEAGSESSQQIQHSELGRREWPHYLVFFEQLLPTLRPLLEGTSYKECKRFFNTHWHDDYRRHGDVVVYCIRR